VAYQTLNLGLQLTIPTAGTRNWAQTLYATTWSKISSHDHTGSGNGAQLGTNALLPLSITTAKLADLAVTTIKLADNAVTTVKITDLNITTGKLADLAVTTLKLAANAVTSAKLALNLPLSQAAVATPAGTTQTLDFDTGMTQRLSLGLASGDVTLTLSNPQAGGLYRILIEQGATARDIIWPAAVKWPQGQKAILSTGNGDVDMVELYYDGTQYLADWQVDFS
jgi:hypothetical protein